MEYVVRPDRVKRLDYVERPDRVERLDYDERPDRVERQVRVIGQIPTGHLTTISAKVAT